MIYLLTFKLSDRKLNNPNIYPYNVFRRKNIQPFVFSKITTFYGNNGSGKSTILNIIANKIEMKGKEYRAPFGKVNYYLDFLNECCFDYGDDEETARMIRAFPPNSRFIKSEDILYEVKKVQQKQVLSDGLKYDYVKYGMTPEDAERFVNSQAGRNQLEYINFAQEGYSNGETSMFRFEELLRPDGLYLLDEPEVSLSPANQVKLAQEINTMARYLNCQFIIATHSPFMLGTLDTKIYNLDSEDCDVVNWYELENVKYFYNFFKKHEKEFE